MDQPQGVRVSIFDTVYSLKVKSESDRAQVEEAARYVDNKMHAIASTTQTIDSFRVAVLAALHIADELHTLKRKHGQLHSAVNAKSLECTALLDAALQD